MHQNLSEAPGKSSYESQIAAEIRRQSRRSSNEWAIFRCCCFSTVLWTTVMNENNNQRCHFLKYLFENPNVSVLQWNALYNFSVMCPILIDTPENYTTKLSRIWACFLKNAWIYHNFKISKQTFCSVETTKFTLILVLLGFSSAVPSPEENSDKFIQGKFLAWSFDFFSSTWQLSIFFNFHFSYVHFIGVFYQERSFVEFA